MRLYAASAEIWDIWEGHLSFYVKSHLSADHTQPVSMKSGGFYIKTPFCGFSENQNTGAPTLPSLRSSMRQNLFTQPIFMKHHIPALAACLLLCHLQCGKPESESGSETFELDKPFAAQVSTQYVELDGTLSLTLNAVVSDSRCPVNATCFWQGSTEIALFFQKDGQSEADTLSISQYIGWPDSAIFQGYKIKFLDVAPDTKAGIVIPQDKYRLKLVVTK
jgi:hypothetical protein